MNLGLGLFGLSVLVDDSVRKIHRPWKERLFSRPWRPLAKFRFEPTFKDGETFKFGDKLIMNSKTRQDLMNAIRSNP